MRILQILKNS